MEYTLAKELKDAGFPSQMVGVCDNKEAGHPFCRADQPDCVKQMLGIPTLKELIESCGSGFGGLVRLENGRWNAATPVRNSGVDYLNPAIEFEDVDPKAAVAKLWLALNSTPKQPQEDI